MLQRWSARRATASSPHSHAAKSHTPAATSVAARTHFFRLHPSTGPGSGLNRTGSHCASHLRHQDWKTAFTSPPLMVCAKCEKKLTRVAASDPYVSTHRCSSTQGFPQPFTHLPYSTFSHPPKQRNRDSQGFLKSTSSRPSASGSAGPSTASSAAGPSRPLAANKLIASKNRYNPLSAKCKICKGTVSQEKATYCSGCAYKKGLCAICGKAVSDTTKFKMSSV